MFHESFLAQITHSLALTHMGSSLLTPCIVLAASHVAMNFFGFGLRASTAAFTASASHAWIPCCSE